MSVPLTLHSTPMLILLIFIGSIIISSLLLLYAGATKIVRPQRIHPRSSTALPSPHPHDYGITDVTPMTIRVPDGVLLRGWFLRSSHPTPYGSILLLHGFSSCKEFLLPLAHFLLNAGFHIIAFDSRAQGQSGGRYCTYGAREVEDIKAILDTIEQRFPFAAPFAVIGHSLGGAIAIQALAAEHRLRCGIIKSAFASLPDIVAHYAKRQYHIKHRWLVNLILAIAGKLAHFDPFTILPERTARRITQPVLVIHGEQDPDVPINHGKRIYRSLTSPHKQWYSIPDGGHYGLEAVAGIEYFQRQAEFLRDHLHPETTDGMFLSSQSRSQRPLS